MPTFCTTAERDFNYHFYLGFDTNDTFFTDSSCRHLFLETFIQAQEKMGCHKNNIEAWVHVVQCNHFGKPTWAQNDAMLAAYLDDMEYYCRLNDDTSLLSKNWTTKYIQALASYIPANVGVVGPDHTGGNEKILTFDFVHKKHIEIFGFYYPRIFPGKVFMGERRAF